MELYFASHNLNKVREIAALLPDGTTIRSLHDLEENEIPETGETLEENSKIKADFLHKKYGIAVFADDTGLEVDALGGAPGVYSARYAGTGNSQDNIDLLLKEMNGKVEREARFKTVITYIDDTGLTQQFTGTAEGQITETLSGTEGFGYDPVFQPKGFDITFAEMNLDEKNKISHRGKAFRLFADHLNK